MVLIIASGADSTAQASTLLRSSGYGYRPTEEGLPPRGRLVVLKAGKRLGTSRITVPGKGRCLVLLRLPLAQDPLMTVQLTNAFGFCWGAEYNTAKRNTATQFRAVPIGSVRRGRHFHA